jgi:hypothetical protein
VRRASRHVGIARTSTTDTSVAQLGSVRPAWLSPAQRGSGQTSPVAVWLGADFSTAQSGCVRFGVGCTGSAPCGPAEFDPLQTILPTTGAEVRGAVPPRPRQVHGHRVQPAAPRAPARACSSSSASPSAGQTPRGPRTHHHVPPPHCTDRRISRTTASHALGTPLWPTLTGSPPRPAPSWLTRGSATRCWRCTPSTTRGGRLRKSDTRTHLGPRPSAAFCASHPLGRTARRDST